MHNRLVYIVALALFCIIVLAPILSMFLDSFMVEGKPSLSNYSEVLKEKRQIGLLVNSLILAIGTTFFCLLIGVPLGFLINRTNIHLRNHFSYLFLAPLVIPPYISTIAWIHLLGSKGILNIYLMKLFSVTEPFFTIYGFLGSIFVLTLSYFPFVTLLTITGLKSFDRRLEEAAEISHGSWDIMKKITLPLIYPYIFSAAIFVFIFSISNYSVPDLLRVNVYPVEIFIQFSAYYNHAKATALSIPLILILFFLIALQRRYMGNKSYVTVETSSREVKVRDLGWWKGIAFAFVLLIIFLSVLVPISDLIFTSRSINAYVVAFKTAHPQIINSFILAFSAATVMVILAFIVSYITERAKKVLKGSLDFVSLLPFAIPATIFGIGLTATWNTPSTKFIYGTSLIIIFGYVARFIPFVIRTIGSNIKQIKVGLEEAALISEPSWAKRILKVVAPLSKSGILAGWGIAFVLSMGELAVTLLVTPAGEATLPIRIYTLMHYGAQQLVAALCIILVCVTLLPIISIVLIGRLSRVQIAIK